MKKIVDNPNATVEKTLQGIEIANPDVLYDRRGIVIARKEKSGKVGSISGGGSNHEPVHTGYTDYDMLDVAVGGNVLASPSSDRMPRGTQLTDSGHGVLLIIKNYAGGIVNFKIAEEFVGIEGIEVDYVVVKGDVAVVESDGSIGRRGITGTVPVHKLAGAKVGTGAPFAEVRRIVERTIENIRSFDVSLSVRTIPAISTYGFMVEEDCMEVGMGIHDEADIEKMKLGPSREIMDTIVSRILADRDHGHSEAVVMVSGLGATPLMELYILASDMQTRPCTEGPKPVKYYVGNYVMAIGMIGASCSILQLDEELKRLLRYPSNTPAFKEVG